jgi:hypothetical protein
MKFYENPYSGSRVVPCARVDMTNVIAAFAVLRTRLKMRHGRDNRTVNPET